jgi:hypothetical protein
LSATRSTTNSTAAATSTSVRSRPGGTPSTPKTRPAIPRMSTTEYPLMPLAQPVLNDQARTSITDPV